MDQWDLVVIGGGTGGYIVATGALRLGLKVMLIEKSSHLGGAALFSGCVPSKALLHVAQVAHTARHAMYYGLETNLAPIDLANVNQHVQHTVAALEKQQDHEAQYAFKQMSGEILYGQAKFIDPLHVQIDNRTIQAKKFVIATGSRPLLPAIQGLDQIGYITSDSVYDLKILPKNLLIIGSSSAAIEFAQAFTRLGSKVSVIVSGDTILPQEDPELVIRLQNILITEGIEFHCNATVLTAYQQNAQKILECKHASGKIFSVAGSDVLVIMDRIPCIEGLGLENAQVNYHSDGIIVNRKLQTSTRHIYALGDVIRSTHKLTHATEYQANIVLSNLVFRYPAKAKFTGFPYVIFTQPEYAHVGLTEHQAKQVGYKKLEITRFEFKDLDSSILQNVTDGLIKVVSHKGKILGATILGPQANNLIPEWSLAINMGARVSDVASTIHAYPTLAQINKRVANKYVARGLFSVNMQRWIKYLQRMTAIG